MVMKKALAALMLFLCITMLIPAAFAETVFPSSPSVTVLKNAPVYVSVTDKKASKKLSGEESAVITSIENGWACVRSLGYIRMNQIAVNQPFKIYAARKTPMYRKASTASRKLTTLPKGAALMIGEIKGNFAYVCDQDYRKGYVSLSAVSLNEPPLPEISSEGQSRIARLISIARSMLGTPYSRYDCSSFTAHCFRKIGISITSSAKYQGYLSGYQRINRISNLKRGDLVVFNTVDDDDLSDHVGIYLGGGEFIHSSSAAGEVIIRQLKTGYYNRTFSWGMRIVR